MMSLLLIVLIAAATASIISNDNDIVENTDPQNLMQMTAKDVDLLDKLALEDKFSVPIKNLCVGDITNGDILLAKATYIFNPSPDKIHSKDIMIKGDSTIGKTAIRVTEVGEPQNGKVFIKEGGVGINYVVIRMQSAKGRGYQLETEVWGLQLNS